MTLLVKPEQEGICPKKEVIVPNRGICAQKPRHVKEPL
jgi:hypothetical protein